MSLNRFGFFCLVLLTALQSCDLITATRAGGRWTSCWLLKELDFMEEVFGDLNFKSVCCALGKQPARVLRPSERLAAAELPSVGLKIGGEKKPFSSRLPTACLLFLLHAINFIDGRCCRKFTFFLRSVHALPK